jgi:2-polyprenyl-3-methyl-5-hydroxy-6-metoxy-1,4-benzoquinol methylase
MTDFRGAPIPIQEQRRAWDQWNSEARIDRLPEASQRQAEVVEATVAGLQRNDLSIIDVGCGTGWMCKRLARYGQVTGTDFVDSTLEGARKRLPMVQFITGDIFQLDLPLQSFDVAVSLEVLSHVADQLAFVARLAALLKPGGTLILATQNRPVYERWSAVAPPAPDRIRQWVNANELKALMAPCFEAIRVCSVVPVGNQGYLRIVNSEKLNKFLSRIIPSGRIERAKEMAMLGNTLIAVATKR